VSGQRVGYAPDKELDQNSDWQLDGVTLDWMFNDRASCRSTARPQL